MPEITQNSSQTGPQVRTRLEQAQIAIAFGSTAPRVVEFPHLIVCSEPATALELVVEALAEPAGIFGNSWPMYDVKGEPYIPAESDDEYSELIIEDFSLYALPENHVQIKNWCVYGDSMPLEWLIPARTRVDVLRAMHTPSPPWDHYAYYIDRLADWLEDLSWALVPLEHEAEFVLVAFGPTASSRLEVVEAALAEHGFNYFHLQRANERWIWPGPIQKTVALDPDLYDPVIQR